MRRYKRRTSVPTTTAAMMRISVVSTARDCRESPSLTPELMRGSSVVVSGVPVEDASVVSTLATGEDVVGAMVTGATVEGATEVGWLT